MQHVNVSLAAGGGLDLLQAAFIRDVLWVGPAVTSPSTAAASAGPLTAVPKGSSPPPLIAGAEGSAPDSAAADEDVEVADDAAEAAAAAAAATVAAAAAAAGRAPPSSEGSPSSVFLDFAGVQVTMPDQNKPGIIRAGMAWFPPVFLSLDFAGVCELNLGV